MRSRHQVLLASLVACGPSAQAPEQPEPSPPAVRVQADAATLVDAAPAPAPPAPFKREQLPVIEPLATAKDSAVFRAPGDESRIELYAVDASADSLLRAIAPRINFAFKATGKRVTGALRAPGRHLDAFATIAAQVGADVSPITASPSSRAARLDVDFTAAPMRDLLWFIGATGDVNIVAPPGDLPAMTIRTRSLPWDRVLEVVSARAGLTPIREGNTYYLVPSGTKVVPSGKHTGGLVDLDAHEASVAEIVTALRALTPVPLGSCSATTVRFRVRRMPLSQVIKALELASGEKLADPAECPATVLADQPDGELVLRVIATVKTKRVAVFSHEGASLIAHHRQPARVTDIGEAFVTLAGGTSYWLHNGVATDDLSRPPPPDYVRTTAIIKRGTTSHALVETATGEEHHLHDGRPFPGVPRVEVEEGGVRTIDEPTPRWIPLAPK